MKTNLITLLLLFSIFAQAQIEEYNYSRSIETPTETWHKIVLPNGIFKQLNSDFTDLRIYGISEKNDTIEAPYLLKSKMDKTASFAVPFKKINASHNENGYYYTFEIENEEAISEIDLNFASDNFDYRVKLEGSQNQREWFTLIEDYRVISIKNELTNYRFSKVVFPSAKYRYFRLLIKSKDDPKLEHQTISMEEKTAGDYQNYKVVSQSSVEDKEAKSTVINFDLSATVPVSNLNLSFDKEVDFYRSYRLQYLADSFQVNAGWKYTYNTLCSGIISSIENNNLSFRPTVLKKLKLTINNADNAPISLEKAKLSGPVYHLVGRFNTPADYTLYYGSEKVRKANYDISRFTDKIPEELKVLDLGVEKTIAKTITNESGPLFQSKFWLWGVMLVMMVLLVWFSVGMLKKG